MSSRLVKLTDQECETYSCFDVLRLATLRGAELSAFESSLNELSVRAITGLQRLPVRLRRRAASHRINRLPFRLHKHHHTTQGNLSTQSQTKKKSKLKSRRFRRRKLRLIDFHTRLAQISNQTNHKLDKPFWLPTHIWHAKRFHMTTKWGWRLPQAPTNKLFKACCIASHKGCLAFDMSYLNCFQLYGLESIISDFIQNMFIPDLYIASQSLPLNSWSDPMGCFEQTGLLCSCSKQNQSTDITQPIIGPVRVLWGLSNSPLVGYRHVWFWVHPSISTQSWSVIQNCVTNINLKNSNQSPLELENLTGRFCRLSLVGRQAHGILMDILQSNEGSSVCENWQLWNHICKSANQAACVPLGLVVNLPSSSNFRSGRPRLKVRNRNWSLLPSNNYMDRESKSRPVTSEINVHLDTQIIRGKQLSWINIGKMQNSSSCTSPNFVMSTKTTLPEDKSEFQLNVLLIQNGSPSMYRNCSDTIGWDIVFSRVPRECAQQDILRGSLAARDFLIACVYRGAEVGGLRDLNHFAGIGTKAGACANSFPDKLWPDTKADEQFTLPNEKMDYCNLLPTNTVNQNVDTKQSFGHLWSELVRPFWEVECEQNLTKWFVLRNIPILRLVVQRMVNNETRAHLTIGQLNKYHPALSRALVMVHIDVTCGIPEPFAIIYAIDNISMCKSIDLEEITDVNGLITLGYVQEGGYNLSVGHGTGLGFISLGHLSKLLTSRTDSNGPVVVACYYFKNPMSSKLHFAKLTVVL